MACYNCFEPGHLKKDCPDSLKKCRFCKQNNHTTSSCCFFCKNNTHPTKECLLNNKCFLCNEIGHTQGKCIKNTKCYNCGKYGHKADRCYTAAMKMCYICQKTDHIAKNCSFNIQDKEDRICNICFLGIGKALTKCCGQRLCRGCKTKWFNESKINFNCPFCRAPHCRSDLRVIDD